jgi:hypothetical protein
VQCEPAAVVSTLANAAMDTSGAAMGTAMARADRLATVLKSSEWEVIEIIRKRENLPGGAAVVDSMAGALRDDEHVTALHQQLAEQHRRALELLEAPAPPPPAPPPPPERPEVRHICKQGIGASGVREVLREVEDALSKDGELRADIDCRVFRVQGPGSKR